MWWPKMDQEIEQMVKACTECQIRHSAPPVAPLHPWKWPTHPWSRLHLDLAGPFLNNMFLILVDAHSKWLEVYPMSSTTSTAVIQRLRTVFAQLSYHSTEHHWPFSSWTPTGKETSFQTGSPQTWHYKQKSHDRHARDRCLGVDCESLLNGIKLDKPLRGEECSNSWTMHLIV